MSELKTEMRIGADGPEMLHEGKWYTYLEVWGVPYVPARLHPDWGSYVTKMRGKAKLAEMRARLVAKRGKR